ncbi:MAG TPA: YafY family protein [Polyangia bacterium]|nr:YafY family protein [Polyangia bacterium]
MVETSARLLELLSVLQTRSGWSGPELAERLEVGVRTVRRDVERLRSLGYPIEATPGVGGGYRLGAGTSLPPLLVKDEEAIAIAVGLSTAAGASVAGIEQAAVGALVKLEQVLPRKLRRRVSALAATTTSLPVPGPSVDPRALTAAAGACRDRVRLRFSYRSRVGAESEREVEPHSLVQLRGRWYLPAWDRDRQDWRTFRLDRLADPVATGIRFQPRTLPADSAAAYVSENLSKRPNRYEAQVTLRAPAAQIQERTRSQWGVIEPIDERSCEFRDGDDNLDWLTLRLLMLDVDFEVHEPPELAAHLGHLSARFARAAGGG